MRERTKRESRFGTWQELRVIRQKDGYSLSALAHQSGVSLPYLSDLENGQRWPNATQLKKLANALNVPVSVLERTKNVDDDGRDVALRDLVRQLVQEEIAKLAA